MISFTCPGCGRSFSVPDQFAGRRASCKSCGGPVVVPVAGPALVSHHAGNGSPATHRPGSTPGGATTTAKIPLRTRRLTADFRQMYEGFANFPMIKVHHTPGDPPDEYMIEYSINGLQPGKGGKPIPRDIHRVQIKLTSDYPRVGPLCKVLTPIFHPNIDPSTICIGDHWTAGERLASLVIRIGEMITYQAYNIQSPLNGEAAMWADLHRDQLPIDTRNLHPAGL